MIVVYGISNCDTVKKTIKWLDKNDVSYSFHDYRKDGCDKGLVESFFESTDWTNLVNKRSTTYRNLADDVKQNLNKESALSLVCEQPTLLKRPVIKSETNFIVGFSEKSMAQLTDA